MKSSLTQVYFMLIASLLRSLRRSFDKLVVLWGVLYLDRFKGNAMRVWQSGDGHVAFADKISLFPELVREKIYPS